VLRLIFLFILKSIFPVLAFFAYQYFIWCSKFILLTICGFIKEQEMLAGKAEED